MAEVHAEQLHSLAELILNGFFGNTKLPGHLFDGEVAFPAQFEDKLAARRELVDLLLECARKVVKQHAFLSTVIDERLVALFHHSPSIHLTMNVVDNTVAGGRVKVYSQALDADLLTVVPQCGKDILYNLFAHLP